MGKQTKKTKKTRMKKKKNPRNTNQNTTESLGGGDQPSMANNFRVAQPEDMPHIAKRIGVPQPLLKEWITKLTKDGGKGYTEMIKSGELVKIAPTVPSTIEGGTTTSHSTTEEVRDESPPPLPNPDRTCEDWFSFPKISQSGKLLNGLCDGNNDSLAPGLDSAWSIEGCTLCDSTTETKTDPVGRMVCEQHNRDFCLVCCVDYRRVNRLLEEDAGLRKKETIWEEAVRFRFIMEGRALCGMKEMNPRPSQEVIDQHCQWLCQWQIKYPQTVRADVEVDRLEIVKTMELRSLLKVIERLNPGQPTFELGGEESQKLYDKYIRAPRARANRVDWYTCCYCGKISAIQLLQCSRCRGASYCGEECQLAAWPSHKKYECFKAISNKDLKKQRLTWAQVEAHKGQPADGKLEVKIMGVDHCSKMGKILWGKDRTGKYGRIGNIRGHPIPEMCVGDTIIWKYPKVVMVDLAGCDHFMANIEKKDWEHIVVS